MLKPSGYTLYALLAVATAAIAIPCTTYAQPSVAVALERNEVYVGEPFILQVQIINGGQIAPPDLSGLSEDFSAEFLADSQSSRTQLVTINGRMVRQEEVRYLLNYRVVVLKPGTLEIPSFDVTVGGTTFTTRPQPVTARLPQEMEAFKLQYAFSKSECYVGEPLVLTTTVYFAESLSELSVTVPLLTSTQFESEALEIIQKAGRLYHKIPLNDKTIIAEENRATLDGRQYRTVTMKHLVVPRATGTLTAPNATASLKTSSGNNISSLLDNFSAFNSQRRNRKFVVPSNEIVLNVKPLPDAGKPANFSGLVGNYRISASASPTEVNVGDPITFEIALGGSYYLKHFDLPSLENQPALAKDFKIPAEMAAGRMEGEQKVFTQTIRAEVDSITEIPSIEVSYFDASTGNYAVASSNPIPLTVHKTTIVDGTDGEIFNPPVESSAVTTLDAGIAHNFSGAELIEDQRFGPNVWLRTPGTWLLLLLPPLAYAALAGTLLYKRFHGLFSVGRNRQLALERLEDTLAMEAGASAVYDHALDALRVYLGTKLDLNASSLTYSDAQPALAARGASEDSLASLKSLFDTCEAHRYAGTAPAADAEARFLDSVRDCVRKLDREIT